MAQQCYVGYAVRRDNEDKVLCIPCSSGTQYAVINNLSQRNEHPSFFELESPGSKPKSNSTFKTLIYFYAVMNK